MRETSAAMAIVLAAGKGTRMKSELPKVLFPARGRPLVAYVLDSLRQAGFERILVVVGYRAELVQQALEDTPGVDFVRQENQLGTGHAVMMCRDALEAFDGPVAIVAGDSPMLRAGSLAELLKAYRRDAPSCLLGTLHHERPAGLGRIVRDSQGEFQAIVEEKDCTPQQREIREVNMSTYVVNSRDLLDSLAQLQCENAQGEYYLTDVPGILKAAGKDVRALPILQPSEALSVNTLQELAAVEEELDRLSSNREP